MDRRVEEQAVPDQNRVLIEILDPLFSGLVVEVVTRKEEDEEVQPDVQSKRYFKRLSGFHEEAR